MRLGAFELRSRIAKGGMGAVYDARHVTSGLPAAVKLVRLDGEAPAFEREVRAVAGLDHPGVVHVFDFGRTPSVIDDMPADSGWIAMEYCSGTLRSRGRLLAGDDVLAMLVEMLAALAHSHFRGVVHRDIKPANILFGTPSDLRPGWHLADFGIAHFLSADLGKPAGTPRFMAPEQMRPLPVGVGPWTDLYALGVTLWCVLTGKRAWSGSKGIPLYRRMLHEPLEDRPFRIQVPSEVRAWIAKCTAKQPEERYLSAGEAAVALADAWGTDWRPTRVRRPAPLRFSGAGLALFPLRRPQFIGHPEALDPLLERLESPGARWMLQGERGIGRTRFLEALRETTIREGRGEAVALEGDSPDAIVTHLARHFRLIGTTEEVEQRLGVLGVTDRTEIHAMVELFAGAGIQDRSWSAVCGLLLRAVAEHRGVLVTLDDAGEGFERLLVLNAAHGAGSSVRSVSSVLPGETVPGERWVLQAPSDGVLADLSRAFLDLTPSAAASLVARSAGRPATLVSILGHAVRTGVLRSSEAGYHFAEILSFPDDALELARSRLNALRLVPVERNALELAAAWGPEVTLDHWVSLGVDSEVAERVGSALEGDGLAVRPPELNGWRFVSAAFRDVVAASASDWAGINAVCAEHAVGPWRRGLHLLEAGDSRAFDVLLEGAARRRGVMHTDSVLQSISVLMGAARDDEQRARIHLAHARVLFSGGRARLAAKVAGQAMEGGSTATVGMAHGVLGRIAHLDGFHDDAIAHMQIAVTSLDGLDGLRSAMFLAGVFMTTGDRVRALETYRKMDDYQVDPDDGAVAGVLATRARILGDLGEAMQLLSRMNALAPIARATRWIERGHLERSLGNPESALDCYQQAIDGLEPLGLLASLSFAVANAALVCLEVQRHDRARAIVGRFFTRLPRVEWSQSLTWPVHVTAMACFWEEPERVRVHLDYWRRLGVKVGGADAEDVVFCTAYAVRRLAPDLARELAETALQFCPTGGHEAERRTVESALSEV